MFFTTNSIWGGSEVLWTQSANKFQCQNFEITAIAKYDFKLLSPFIRSEKSFFNLSERFVKMSRLKSILNKTGLHRGLPGDKLHDCLDKGRFDLAIISQGNNTEGYEFMTLCTKYKIPFVTITHLVVESSWPGVTDDRIEKFRVLYDKAIKNFFVSKKTLQMHEKFFGYSCFNSEIIYNPFIKQADQNMKYPPLLNGKYMIALLGRLECYHKGYDLLIEVLSLDKWKNRNIGFTIYGEGPHLRLIKKLVEINHIKNLEVKAHVNDINEVWKNHHLLMMPSRLEGQSLTLIEAMNFKRAAVVTNVGGVEELLEDGLTGFIAEYASPKAIDHALERAWNQRAEWEEMGIKASIFIKEIYPPDSIDYFNKKLMCCLNVKKNNSE